MRLLSVATSWVGRGVRPGLSRRIPSNSCCTTCICSLAAACRCCPAVTSLCDAVKSPFRARTSSYIQAAPIKLDETEHYSRMEFRNSLLKPVGSLNSVSCGQWQLHTCSACPEDISSPCGLQLVTGLGKICITTTVKCLQYCMICTLLSFFSVLIQLHSFLCNVVRFDCQSPAAL